MRLLYGGKVAAGIMPMAVGLYHAGQMGLAGRILSEPDPGPPLAIAVKKGNPDLLE